MASYKKQILTSEDHLGRVSKASTEKAIAELIWNSLDADATVVDVKVKDNELGNEQIIISDNGTGITKDIADSSFSMLGNSWKSKERQTGKGRTLHGEKGEGRFKALSLGHHIQWNTSYKKGNDFYNQTFTMNSSNLLEVHYSGEKNSSSNSTGTEVTISNLEKKYVSYDFSRAYEKLVLNFANYLITYPDVTIRLLGKKLDPNQEISEQETIKFTVDGIVGEHNIKIIEWKNISAKEIHLCKANGAVLVECEGNINKRIKNAKNYSIYICSDFINELNRTTDLSLIEMDNFGASFINRAIEEINNYLKDKLNKENLERIENWKKDGIYPYDDEEKDPVKILEKDVFDIVAVNVEDKLSNFKNMDINSKKFTFKLLYQALQDNPKSIQKILGEVLSLSKADQEVLAGLLEKTTLPSIIKSAKVVADRLNFILGLEELIFDPDNKKALLERDQLHKILEQESWIFSEHYSLSGSELGLTKVLDKHMKLLGNRGDSQTKAKRKDKVLLADGSQGRVDLMFNKAVEVRAGEFDYLVVELKRPSQKITTGIIDQITNYAITVAEDERFDKAKSNWLFIAVSNEFDNYAESRANQKGMPKGVVFQSDNVTVKILKWSEVISDARARLIFYRNQLEYKADEQSMKDYLETEHSKYLPKTFDKN